MSDKRPDIHIILAVDPGKATGWAMWMTSPETGETYASGEEPLPVVLNWAHDILATPGSAPYVEIVCEAYIVTRETIKKSRQYEPLEGIGALRHLADRYSVPFTLQTPAAGKKFGTNSKLKAMEFWHVGGAGHANDAGRHMLLYLTSKGYIDPAVFVEGDNHASS